MPHPAFSLQRQTAPAAVVLVWGVIAYNIRQSLVLIRGTKTAQWYAHDLLQPHVLTLMQWFPGAIFEQDNARPLTAKMSQKCLRTVTTLPWPARFPDMPPIEHFWKSFTTSRWAFHEFERTRDKVTAMTERNVSRHDTKLECINAQSASYRAFALEGVQQGIKSSVPLSFSLK
ncbi:transposable element Tcb2 transposase [Trichonephila clavipes]|nr:transposable element Tcb2 transposase [Trichonephila clavipes]